MTYSSTVRVLTYVVPSLALSILLNIPKFMEAKLVTHTYKDMNMTVEITAYDVTNLRVNPDYVYYYIHWTRWDTKVDQLCQAQYWL